MSFLGKKEGNEEETEKNKEEKMRIGAVLQLAYLEVCQGKFHDEAEVGLLRVCNNITQTNNVVVVELAQVYDLA